MNNSKTNTILILLILHTSFSMDTRYIKSSEEEDMEQYIKLIIKMKQQMGSLLKLLQKSIFKLSFQNQFTQKSLFYVKILLEIVKDQQNMPNLKNIFVLENKVHIIIDYFKHKPWISYFDTFTMDEVKHYIYQLLNSISVLQKNGIYHRDVKPANFLYNPKIKQGRLVDFGLSEVDSKFVEQLKQKQSNQINDMMIKPGKMCVNETEQDQKQQVQDSILFQEMMKKQKFYENIIKCEKIIGTMKFGTECFMPLESHLKYKGQNYSVDTWAVGVIFFEFIAKKYNIFNNCRLINKLKIVGGDKNQKLKSNYIFTYIMELGYLFGTDKVKKALDKYNYEVEFPINMNAEPQDIYKMFEKVEGYTREAHDLLIRLLDVDCDTRICATEALKHPFLQNLPPI